MTVSWYLPVTRRGKVNVISAQAQHFFSSFSFKMIVMQDPTICHSPTSPGHAQESCNPGHILLFHHLNECHATSSFSLSHKHAHRTENIHPSCSSHAACIIMTFHMQVNVHHAAFHDHLVVRKRHFPSITACTMHHSPFFSLVTNI